MPDRHGSGAMGGSFKVSPLGALVAIVILGVTIEIVEQQDKKAAYVLVIILLLGMITFNSGAFTSQISAVLSVLNQPISSHASGSGASRSSGFPSGNSSGGGKAGGH